MPKTAIPGTPDDPLADPFDLWNGKMQSASPTMGGDLPFDSPAPDPQIGTVPKVNPPPVSPEPEDPYTPPVVKPVHYGVVGDAGSANPSMPLGDPNQPPPQVGGQATLGNPGQPNPQIGHTAGMPLGNPNDPSPGVGNPDMDRVLLTYLLSHGGF